MLGKVLATDHLLSMIY